MTRIFVSSSYLRRGNHHSKKGCTVMRGSFEEVHLLTQTSRSKEKEFFAERKRFRGAEDRRRTRRVGEGRLKVVESMEVPRVVVVLHCLFVVLVLLVFVLKLSCLDVLDRKSVV